MTIDKHAFLPMNNSKYIDLIENIKAIGKHRSKDVMLIVKPWKHAVGLSTDTPYDFITDAKSFTARLKQDFKIDIKSTNSGQAIIEVETIKSPKLPTKATNARVITGFISMIHNLKLVDRDNLKCVYMALMDKHRK